MNLNQELLQGSQGMLLLFTKLKKVSVFHKIVAIVKDVK